VDFARSSNSGSDREFNRVDGALSRLIITLRPAQAARVLRRRLFGADGGLLLTGLITPTSPAGEVTSIALLTGEKPANMPVARHQQYEWSSNLKDRQAARPRVPEPMLARADEVIESRAIYVIGPFRTGSHGRRYPIIIKLKAGVRWFAESLLPEMIDPGHSGLSCLRLVGGHMQLADRPQRLLSLGMGLREARTRRGT